MKFNILNNFDKNCYYSHPFPHFIIPNALDDALYKKLGKEYDIIENYFRKQMISKVTTSECNLIKHI